MSYVEYLVDDIEALEGVFSSFLDTSMEQMSPGNLGSVRGLSLPGMSVYQFEHEVSVRIEDRPVSAGLTIRGFWKADRCIHWRGNEVDPGGVIVERAGESYDYVLPKNVSGFAIDLAPAVIEELGWDTCTAPVVRTRSRSGSQLRNSVQGVLERARRWGEIPPDPVEEGQLRDWLLRCLAMELPLTSAAARRQPAARLLAEKHAAIVRKAEAQVGRLEPDEPIIIPELAAATGVSSRTLHRAFRNWAGVGPLRYFSLRRLHAFRRQMLAGDGERGAITEAALANGFTHLGHLSEDYRNLFGESPRETLRRRDRRCANPGVPWKVGENRILLSGFPSSGQPG